MTEQGKMSQQSDALKKAAVRIVVKGLILLGRAIPIGYLLQSRHARDFSKAAIVKDGQMDEVVPAVEFCDPDEDQLFHDVMMSFAGDCLKYEKAEGRAAHFEDLHWGYTKALIEGELEITDVESLPKDCRVGLFERPGQYPVVSRPNFLRNTDDTIKVSRLSLKMRTEFNVPNFYNYEGRAQELDLLFSEGVRQDQTGDQDGQGFFFRDARQLRYVSWFSARKILGLASLLNKANSDVFITWQQVMKTALDTLYKPEHAQKSWDEKDYYSAGPYALGGVLVKFALRSQQPSHANTRTPGPLGPARDQGAWFEAWQSTNEPALFDLCVQVARFGALPTPDKAKRDPCKAVMATEYTDLVWDEDISPFQPVGILTLKPAAVKLESRPWFFQPRDRWNPRDQVQPYALRFNAWNTLSSMTPVGQLFRARKKVHVMHRETRLRHTFQAKTDPKAMCPVKPNATPKTETTE